ncbi:MAG: type II 3-dehydroquinate dehydratase [Halobacteriota archaeon]|nr:type II 3-dehydroquinate dehydratase [Halobacteriota archaeon]
MYGTVTLERIEEELKKYADSQNVEIKTAQSNNEGDIINEIHNASNWANGIIINPGAYAHYSYAIRDAIAAIKIPVIEVHISNIFSREEFRHQTPVTSVCKGLVVGFGWSSYLVGLFGLIDLLIKE